MIYCFFRKLSVLAGFLRHYSSIGMGGCYFVTAMWAYKSRFPTCVYVGSPCYCWMASSSSPCGLHWHHSGGSTAGQWWIFEFLLGFLWYYPRGKEKWNFFLPGESKSPSSSQILYLYSTQGKKVDRVAITGWLEEKSQSPTWPLILPW